ncbi:Mitochondrial import inner membrane translocase subunit TIM50 [Acorus calamus]|uniref:Mitochondrial import inner membrane translocase subunit TIM50 n=1 Tax=Acorus calamus TaxID=4465 RepID=A0AAV9C9M6_ACOCL|nr:Mitochondrial import inner membrane translocase subunit TIM50 [Acorus calamus]
MHAWGHQEKAFLNPTKKAFKRPSPLKKKKNNNNLSPSKSIVLSNVNRSIRTCGRRLLKIFANLAKSSATKDGFHLLKRIERPPQPPPSIPHRRALPPSDKKTLFLDLDETLIHSWTGDTPPPEKYDFVVHPRIDGQDLTFYVLKRPGVDELLVELAARDFEVVVFTAGLEAYASLVLDRIDRTGVIAHRLYRDSCIELDGGGFTKDLGGIGRDLKRVVIVDDNPNAYALQPENAVPVRPFVDDLKDTELKGLVEFLEVLERFEDTRDAVAYYRLKNDVKER